MERIKIWIEKHPYLTGGLVLALLALYLIFKSRSSVGGTQVVQAGVNPALAAAQLQAQTQQSAIQAQAGAQNAQLQAAVGVAQLQAQTEQQKTQAEQTVGLAQVGDGVEEAQIAAGAQTSIAGTNAAAAVSIAQTQGSTQVQLATIQAPIQMAQIQASLDAQKDIDATQLGIATVQTGGAVQIAGINANADVAKTTSNNATTLAVAGLQAGVANNYIDTQGQVQQNFINSQTALGFQQLGLQSTYVNQFFASLNAGIFNKGGEGGANQVSAFGAFSGQPSVGQAAQQTAASDSAAPWQFGTSLIKAGTGIFSSIFG